MLRAMDRVMKMQWPIVQGDKRLMKAWHEGDRYWRDHFGVATIKELFANLLRLNLGRVALAIVALIRYVRGQIFLLPWKNRRRLLKVVGRRPIKSGKEANSHRPAARGE
jgi:hypothetical protein